MIGPRVGRILHKLARQDFLLKLGSARQDQDLVEKKAQRSLTKVWLSRDSLSP